MLKYESIYIVNQARRRMDDTRRDRYAWRQDGVTRDQDQLSLFTLETAAVEDSAHNLAWLLDVAREHDQKYMILKDMQIQVAGHNDTDCLADVITPRDWMRKFREWVDSDHQQTFTESSEQGEVMHFNTWRRCLATREHQGVYEVATGRRLTNREEIIRSFWDMGFATWRGRPYSIAKLRWSGNREELEEVTELYHRHYHRSRTSDMARKMVSAFRSINRYAAWPGAW